VGLEENIEKFMALTEDHDDNERTIS
jgi:hypothetical protein